jgi:hypothetical protein
VSRPLARWLSSLPSLPQVPLRSLIAILESFILVDG